MIAISTCSWNTPRPTAEDILIRITVANRGPEAANLRLLPTVWFRNTWSWGGRGRAAGCSRRHSGARSGRSNSNESTVPASAGCTVKALRNCFSPKTKPTRAGSSELTPTRAVCQGRHQRLRGRTARPEAVNPERTRHEGSGPLPVHDWSGRDRRCRLRLADSELKNRAAPSPASTKF